MNRLKISVLLLLVLSAAAFAIDVPMSDTSRLDIVSRTSFGIDLDNPYRFGLSNELTQLDLVFGLAPYQKLSNRLTTPGATGFINLTLFHLDLIKVNKDVGYHVPGNIGTNRYQTGEFLVITKRGEENMAGDGQTQEHATMKQFGFDINGNIADRFGQNVGGQMVAAMYNTDNFGVNLKLGTEYSFESANITADNRNGLAAGIDSVFTPTAVPGIKIFASLMGTKDYSFDEGADPLFGGTRVGYTIPLNEELSVEPWAGFDIGTRFKDEGGVEEPGYEASVGLTMRWPGQGGWFKDYILNSDGRVFPGMSLGYKIYEETEIAAGPEHSIKFTLFEPKGDEGLFFGLGSEIIVDLVNLTSTTGVVQDATGSDPTWSGFSVLATAYFDYELNNIGKLPGTLIPWTILYYDNLPGAAISSDDDRINDMKVDLGLNLENAIANTTFGVVWNTGSLIQQTQYHWGYIRLMVEIRL